MFFYACDMFNQWKDSIDCQVFALVLNYLLSDSQKYMKETQLKIFLDSIVDFIMCHKVKFLVFNDINYFGYTNLDSEKGFDFFQKFLKENGILSKLEEIGLEEGDTVNLYGLRFEYYK